MKELLLKIHYFIINLLAKSWVVEHILIAKVEDETGDLIDCIYCTILRNAVLFSCIGCIIGMILANIF